MKYRLTFFAFVIFACLMTVSCATVKSPLITASSKGDSITVQKLVKDGANINEADANGYTPLIYAVWSGNIEVVKTLLSLGADVNQKDKSGCSAVYYATYNGTTNIANLLYLANRAMKKAGVQEVKKVCKDFQEDAVIMSKGRPLYEAHLNYRYLYPKINYTGNKKISVMVRDRRPYVLSKEKAGGYVGWWRERGVTKASTYDIGTLSQKPLSDDLTFCISEALIDAGFLIVSNYNQTETASKTDRIIYVNINEWVTDTFSATGLNYNLDIKIFDTKNVLLGEKQIKGEDNLGGSGGMRERFIYESVPAATEDILSKMLNAPDIQAALRD
jgi:ankyrin repeat protein